MKRLLAILLAICMVISLAACNGSSEVPQETEPTQPATEPEPTAADIYNEAAALVQAKSSLKIKLNSEKNTVVAKQTFSEVQALTVSLNGVGSDSFVGKVSGVVRFGPDYSAMLEEYTIDDTVYGSMEGAYYTAPSTQEEFFTRYAPVVLLDPALYSTVELNEDGDIVFSDATAPESWLGLEDCTLVDATGVADFEDDELIGYEYDLSYSMGSADVTLHITAELKEFSETVETPDLSLHNYLSLANADIPLILERGRGAILQSQSLSIENAVAVTSAAGNCTVSNAINLNMTGFGDTLQAYRTSTVVGADLSTGKGFNYYLEESFVDNVFSASENGGKPEQLDDITGESIRSSFLFDYLGVSGFAEMDGFVDLEDLSSVTYTEVPGGYVLDFNYSDAYTDTMKYYACGNIFEDPKVLDDNATSYELLSSNGYVALDAVTGLPTAVSSTYSATHTIEGGVYPLRMDRMQSIDAASLSAYTAITGEPLEMDADLPQPTPLFYKVTGENNEQMWLFGTIHVGDSRTENLPQGIYDALQNADALALEFDMSQFEQQLMEDEALAQQALSTYIYADGSTITQHLTNMEVYAMGRQLLKFAGEYNSLSDAMRPTMWSNTIENFYLDLGYRLSSQYGVDNQLLQLAQEQEKTVLNVESGIEQMKMMSGFSDGLQEQLLISAISTTPAQYNAQVEELYEMWCAGDEAAFLEYFKTDNTDLTGLELAYAQEYTKAMETDRNAKMLRTAIGYLESGDTVFYAVGLAHLMAEDGLVNTLREAGYKVELVTFQ